jgi:hypothetical protein
LAASFFLLQFASPSPSSKQINSPNTSRYAFTVWLLGGVASIARDTALFL